jgi:hypothetical protein
LVSIDIFRVPYYESKGRVFESRRAHFNPLIRLRLPIFFNKVELCQKAIQGCTLPLLKGGCSKGADITIDILRFISSCGEVLAEGTASKRQLILAILARVE